MSRRRTGRGSSPDPHIVLTEQDGTATSLLLLAGSPLNRGPVNGQQQVTTVGETERRGDSRTPEVIYADQSGGMGEFAYQEINGVLSFTDSDCDTRYPGLIALPPARTLLGTMTYVPGADAPPVHIEYVGGTTAKILTWQWDISSSSRFGQRFDTTGTPAFVSLLFQNITGYAHYNSYFIFALATAGGAIKYSTDGQTWNTTAYPNTLTGCCTHDGKLYFWDVTQQKLVWTTDPTTTPAGSPALWGASSSNASGEAVMQLVEWQANNRRLVFVVTKGRILWYDEDADAFHVLDDFRDLVNGGTFPWAHAWRRDGNLYLTLYSTGSAGGADAVIWYAGTINLAGPNLRGGMLTTSQVSLSLPVGNRRWLFFAGLRPPGTANAGRTLLMTDQQQFHTISPAPAASSVVGVGYDYSLLWTALADGKVYEQAVPDSGALPLYASGRSYNVASNGYHEYAFTDLGTENLPKLALWVTVTARDHTSTYKTQGMASGCSAVVQWLRDTDSAWQTLGTVDTSSTWPATLPFNVVGGAMYGVSFYQMKIRLQLLSAGASASPMITSVALACLREEWVRDRYQVAVDLSDARLGSHPLYRGKTRAQLLTILERMRQPGHLVKVQFAGGDEANLPSRGRTVTSCKLEFTATEDATAGPGAYTLSLVDYTAPTPATPVALPHS